MIDGLLVGLSKLISGANVRWVNCRPEATQRVYFANHTSHLDFIVIWSALPHELRIRTRPVAGSDYWERGRLRRYLATQVFNALLIDRERVTARNNPIDRVLTALDEGCSLILFPEGTRGDGEIGAFKSGLYHICARKAGIELVPVYLENLNRVLPKGEILPVPVLSSVTFGPPISLHAGECKEDFLERARDAIVSLRQS